VAPVSWVVGQDREVTLQVVLTEEKKITLAGELARVFEDHHALVFRTAYRITGNPADAEDVLQTIFLRLLKRPDSGTVKDRESYLRRAAINASLDVIRARKDDRAVPIMDMPSAASDRDLGELKSVLRRALGRLSPRSAEVFALRFFEGLSNQEIARMLGVSRVSIAVMVHRARQQLRRDLRAYK
jgi:RNA polymerase sigma-70 factor (ECF subfamily)